MSLNNYYYKGVSLNNILGGTTADTTISNAFKNIGNVDKNGYQMHAFPSYTQLGYQINGTDITRRCSTGYVLAYSGGQAGYITIPSWASRVSALCIGGGGAGGACGVSTRNDNGASGAGGGAGCYVVYRNKPIESSGYLYYSVGGGGNNIGYGWDGGGTYFGLNNVRSPSGGATWVKYSATAFNPAVDGNWVAYSSGGEGGVSGQGDNGGSGGLTPNFHSMYPSQEQYYYPGAYIIPGGAGGGASGSGSDLNRKGGGGVWYFAQDANNNLESIGGYGYGGSGARGTNANNGPGSREYAPDAGAQGLAVFYFFP